MLGNAAFIFNKLNQVYKEATLGESSALGNGKARTVIDQTDMLSRVFCMFEETPNVSSYENASYELCNHLFALL